MAKMMKSVTFNNAMIDMGAMEIIEHDKNGDEVGRFALTDVFQTWDGIYGITVSIKQSTDLGDQAVS